MKNFSISRLAELVLTRRKQQNLTQQQLADRAGINRTMLCKLENQEYVPSLDQLTRLANTLGFDAADVFIEYTQPVLQRVTPGRIAVYGAGTAGLAVATLLSRQHEVTLADSDPELAERINRRTGPFEDPYIEKYFTGASLRLTATTDPEHVCRNADYAVVAVPTGFRAGTARFDTSGVEETVGSILKNNSDILIVIRSDIPVGYTAFLRGKYHTENIVYSPEFARKAHALYDNLYPARIVVGCGETIRERAEAFAAVLKNSALKRDVEVLITGTEEAETIRVFSDVFLAVHRSCINELDSFAEARGLSAGTIIRGVCLDPRIGNHDSNPTFGAEIPGLPENLEQVMAGAKDIPPVLLAAVTESNRNRLNRIAESVLRLAGIGPETEEALLSGEKQVTAGIYRPAGIGNAGPCRNRSIEEIMKRLRARGVGFVVYEPTLKDGSLYFGGKVVNNLKRFKKQSSVILADHFHDSLNDVKDRVYTRSLITAGENAEQEDIW